MPTQKHSTSSKKGKKGKKKTSPDWDAITKRGNERFFTYEGENWCRCIEGKDFCEHLGKETLTGPEIIASDWFQLRMKYVGDSASMTEALVWDRNGDILVLNEIQQKFYRGGPSGTGDVFMFGNGRGRGKPKMVYQSEKGKGAGTLYRYD